ncbi:phosphatidylinositol transfer protein 3 [Quercus suber]|uniref:Phosphatidylinositol transfer protein 3 n=1 Tax=Quercus suber TaxID=58331 RepID=A0AAW0J217_QUESU
MYMMMMNSNKSESRESTELEEAGGRYHDEDNRLKSNNKIELTRIRLMRSFVETQDPSSKASALFLKYLKWRQTFVPNGSISASELPHEIAQNKMFIQGFDKTGRPIAVVLGARHFQTEGGIEEFKRFVVYGLDKLCSRMPPGQEKFAFIADLEGWGYSNSDIRAYLGALSILQDFYPERLGKVFIIHAPYIFMTVWKIVYPFIDKNTKKKILFVENKSLKSTLLEEIDESQLPEIYGGQLPLVPTQDS